ncbi:tyrosine--tRNA ligase [Mycoplasmopsis alligatoris]|uniref:Tyrosine--tRNA ligase n=1 Tax=Mycoplasmopsis alligatoris A21JP2 TaxID=747682 RepID=D4XWD2_9BACT|nr:tyrosine--tRNA ligase [Mycoplasmopsis alligatoris]EFF41146.1 tyrosine--tRNA ligase [Mycoplasmopsis alligatoris A21JP2]
MNILDDLKQRGILKQVSNEQKLNSLEKNSGVYSGFDPTAKSLHLGNYIVIINLLRFKKFGFKPVAILGGTTGMIGDPSFKDSERVLLDEKTIFENKLKIKEQLEKFGLEVIDNYDFYKDMNVIDFLRNIGKLINVSYMLAKDSVASRIEKGLSFTEFSYQLIQGYDFYKLYKDNNVFVQCGGSDQWGNLTAGLEIISKNIGDSNKAVAITFNLLTDSEGNKFGKSTGGGSLWLDKEMNSPYNLYQFLYNQPDSEVEKLLNQLTLLEIDYIKKVINEHLKNTQKRYAQEILAYQVVSDIHSKNDAEHAKLTSQIMFNKTFDFTKISINQLNMVKNQLKIVVVNKNTNLIDELISKKIINSKREAREFISTKSLKWNMTPIDEEFITKSTLFDGKYAILHKGKKQIYLVEIA